MLKAAALICKSVWEFGKCLGLFLGWLAFTTLNPKSLTLAVMPPTAVLPHAF